MRGITTQLIRQLSAAANHRTDGELLNGFLTQSVEADFAELVRRHGSMIWGVCCRVLPDQTDAEDAFQTVFLVLVRRGTKLVGLSTIGPWLHRVAVWTARNIRRRNAHRLSKRATLVEELPATSIDRDLSLDLDGALLALPEKFRSCIVLCHLMGYSRAEAAAQLGCPEGTLSAWLSRGLAKLRTKLADLDPTRALLIPAVALPAGLSGSVVRAAVALHAMATMSSTLSSAIPQLVEGVIRMFWIKKATAASAALLAMFALGVGVGVSTHQLTPASGGEEHAVLQKTATPTEPPTALITEDDEAKLDNILKDLSQQLAELEAAYKSATEGVKLSEQKAALAKLQQQFDPKDLKSDLETLEGLQKKADATRKKLDELKPIINTLREYKAQISSPKLKQNFTPDKPLSNAPGPKFTPDILEDVDKKVAELMKLQADLQAKLEIENANSKLKEAVLQLELKKIEEKLAALQMQKELTTKAPTPTKAAGGYFQLTVGAKDSAWPFQIKEYGPDGKLIGTTAFENAAVLGRFLTRAMKDSTAPKEVRISAQKEASVESLKSAIEALKVAGVAQPSSMTGDDPRLVKDLLEDALNRALESQRETAAKMRAEAFLRELEAKQRKAEADYLYRETVRRAQEFLQKKAEQPPAPPKP